MNQQERDEEFLGKLRAVDEALYQTWRKCVLGSPEMYELNRIQAEVVALMTTFRQTHNL